MSRSLKGGLMSRRRSALARLEAQYEAFKAAGQDKPAHDSTRRGRVIHHQGRSYADECARLQQEIKILKSRV